MQINHPIQGEAKGLGLEGDRSGEKSKHVITISWKLTHMPRRMSKKPDPRFHLLYSDIKQRIKKAYHKKALSHHPDRNYGNVETATRQFAEIQTAYEILSDPEERAWYDSHKDAILRYEDDISTDQYERNVRITTAGDILRIFVHFRGKLDFSDSATGFYTKLRGTFETLAKEEEEACGWERLHSVDYPSFGQANDSYEDVVRPFYAMWGGFATKKTFSWEEIYCCTEAPDRRVRRLMEKENKRLREEGIREFNEAVRALVAFVKKRDPRFKPKSQSEVERQTILRVASLAQAARSRAANQEKEIQREAIPEWAKSGELQEPALLESDAEEVTQEEFECVVCRKNFKSENQYEAHANSKKHFRAVQHLRRQMHAEDWKIRFNDSCSSNPPSSLLQGNATDTVGRFVEMVNDHPNYLVHDGHQDEWSGDTGDAVNIESPLHQAVPANPGKGFKNRLRQLETEDFSGVAGIRSSEPVSDDEYSTKATAEKRPRSDRFSGNDESPFFPPTEIGDPSLVPNFANQSLNEERGCSPKPKARKAKERRAKKAAKKSTANTVSEEQLKCATCHAGHTSKSRLFKHIKDFDHAQPVAEASKGSKAGKQRGFKGQYGL